MADIKIEGILRIRDVPQEWSEEDFKYWWCDERTESGLFVRKARMSEREKDRYTVAEARNRVLTAGVTQILTFLGNTLNNSVAFSQYYAVGTGVIYTTTPIDTTLASELFRKVPTGSSVSGSGVTVSTLFLTSEGNGTYTNCALFGNGATSTPNSGTMMTHLIISFIKTSANPRANDYLITAQAG